MRFIAKIKKIALSRDRTYDLSVNSRALYLLSYKSWIQLYAKNLLLKRKQANNKKIRVHLADVIFETSYTKIISLGINIFLSGVINIKIYNLDREFIL